MSCQQLRKSDSCFEESFSVLMHGGYSAGRLCVLEVCAARDSLLTNMVRQRLHDISVAERWTSHDHEWQDIQTKGQHCRILIWCDQSIPCFFLRSLLPVLHSQMDDEPTEGDTLSARAACWFKNNSPLEMRMSLLNVHLAP